MPEACTGIALDASALAVWWWQGRPRLTREMLPAHLTRGVLIAATAFLFFFALSRLGLAERSPSR